MGDTESNRLLHVLYLFLTVGFIIAITFLVAGMDAVISFFFWLARRNDRAANRTGDLYWYVRWNQTEHPNRNRPIDLTLLREQQLAEDNERERLINNLETLRDEMRQLEMELSNNMHLREETA
ncbi:unnamed protein product [Orchesella dallaii]|uniref:Uncharacterized protein n=1 Tax=Orchesella dallaii TaxID=48710 RepID=A0ABP1RDQ1_9HEXA